MNIFKVRDNLEQTIRGKENFREALRASLPDVSHDLCATAEGKMMLQMLELNIQDLRKILFDVEICVKQANNMSWELNPERMGR